MACSTFVAPVLGTSSFTQSDAPAAPAPSTVVTARRPRMVAAGTPPPLPFYLRNRPVSAPAPRSEPVPVKLTTVAPVKAIPATPPPSATRTTAPAARQIASRGPAVAVVEEEKEANEGDPYLRATMRQYVPGLLTSAFLYGCIALGNLSATIGTMPSPM